MYLSFVKKKWYSSFAEWNTPVAAQRLNADGQPLYGCYVVGSYWRFVLLEGQTYSVSQGYDASDAGELRIIWSALMNTKQLIEERVQIILDSES